MVERVPMSTQGYQKLRDELRRLEKIDRIDVVKAIEVARAHGDLKENAEYHAAKERQGHIEGRIRELKDKLGRAEVINCMEVPTQRAVFGTVVTLSTISREEARRPLRSFGSTSSRKSGASVSSVVKAQMVIESVASKLSS